MQSIEVDQSRGSLMTVRYHGAVDDDSLERCLEQICVRLAQGAPFIILVDARSAVPSAAPHRHSQANFLRDQRERLANREPGPPRPIRTR